MIRLQNLSNIQSNTDPSATVSFVSFSPMGSVTDPLARAPFQKFQIISFGGGSEPSCWAILRQGYGMSCHLV